LLKVPLTLTNRLTSDNGVLFTVKCTTNQRSGRLDQNNFCCLMSAGHVHVFWLFLNSHGTMVISRSLSYRRHCEKRIYVKSFITRIALSRQYTSAKAVDVKLLPLNKCWVT